MDICFVANYTKTFFQNALAIELKKSGYNIFWIVVNINNYEFLRNNYEEKNILYLPKDEVFSSNNSSIFDFKLNELIYGDRVMKYDYDSALEYLTKIQKSVFNFISINSISFVFGETTWAHEILISRIIIHFKSLNSVYLNPHTIRIPSNRFAFFTSEFQDNFLLLEPDYVNKSLPVDSFKLIKPDYLLINDNKIKASISFNGRLKRLKSFITSNNLDINDPTLLKPKSKYNIVLPIKNEINKELYKRVKTIGLDFLADRKFLLVTLHKQPEASIDVIGRYVEDQTQNILNLWRMLPEGWLLVVKEHSNAIGDRSLSWYNNLIKYNNIFFANEKLDSYDLIDLCQAVYTVSGTIAYEAALKNKSALVSTNTFFNFPYVKKVTTDTFLKSKNLIEILDEIPDENINISNIKKKIYFNSFKGIISDPLNNPLCMEKSNINIVVKAFLRILKK